MPKLQVQTPAEAHVYRGWQEAADWGIQATDALPEAGDATVLHCGVRSPEWSPTLPFQERTIDASSVCVWERD